MFIVTTTSTRNKIAQARKGDIPMPVITAMVLGTGGHMPGDVTTPVSPTSDDTALETQVVSKAPTKTIIDGVKVRNYISITDADEVNDTIFTEAGLIDDDGDLAVRMTFSGKEKVSGVNLDFQIDELF